MINIHQHQFRSILLVTFILSLPEWTCGWSREERHVITQPPPQGPTMPPVFDPYIPTNITITASKTALLSCVVHNLNNNSVSWIRDRDLHILSVGSVTYTSDSRFQAVPIPGSGNWMLRIMYTQPRDTGQYDCQVSSRPPIARATYLTVIEPQAKILLSPEMYVGLGSPINLTCFVPYSPEPPHYLHWYYQQKMVREDGSRVTMSTQLGKITVSQLVIRNATPKDSGTYTCSPASSKEDYITVHVLADEYPAAMQKGWSLTHGSSFTRWTIICICLSLLLCSS